MVSRSVALGDVALVLEEPAVNLAVEGLLNRCGMPGGVRDQGGGFWHALSWTTSGTAESVNAVGPQARVPTSAAQYVSVVFARSAQ